MTARCRRREHVHRLGGRAHLSGGLPGAEWWVAGPAAVAPEDADVAIDEVATSWTEHGLWERLPG